MGQRHQPRRGGQLGQHFRRDEPLGTDLHARRPPRAGLRGDHMHHHRPRGPPPGRTIRAPAATPEAVGVGGQRPQRISAALLPSPWVMRTHRGRQRIQAPIQGVRIRGVQGALQVGQPITHVGHPHLPAGHALLAPAHRIHIRLGHDLVDLGGQPALTQRRPAAHRGRQHRVHRPQHLTVIDQIRAEHNGLKHPVIDIPGAKHRPHFRQAFAHRAGIAHPARGQALADPQLRAHLRGHRRLGVHRPLLALRTAREPIGKQLPDRHQLRRRRPILHPRHNPDLFQQGRRLRRRRRMTPLNELIKLRDHRTPPHLIEHTFDYATGNRQSAYQGR